jgi:hypothetical protein
VKLFFNPGTLRGFATGMPNDLVVDRVIGGVPATARKQPLARSAGQPAIMLAQFSEQVRAEHDVPVLTALTAAYVDHHARGVNVGDFEIGQFGAPDARSVESHQDRPVKWRERAFNQASYFILAQDDRQTHPFLRIRCLLDMPGPLQSPGVKEAKRCDTLSDGVVSQLAFTEQVRGIFAYLLGAELVGRTVEETREVLDGSHVRARGRFSVVTTLEFLEHHFSKMGHKDLLVTRP